VIPKRKRFNHDGTKGTMLSRRKNLCEFLRALRALVVKNFALSANGVFESVQGDDGPIARREIDFNHEGTKDTKVFTKA